MPMKSYWRTNAIWKYETILSIVFLFAHELPLFEISWADLFLDGVEYKNHLNNKMVDEKLNSWK